MNALNAMLENVNGEVRLTHHPRCRALRKDFETVTWEDNGAEINKLDNEKTHATDALGYFIEYEFGLRLNRRTRIGDSTSSRRCPLTPTLSQGEGDMERGMIIVVPSPNPLPEGERRYMINRPPYLKVNGTAAINNNEV